MRMLLLIPIGATGFVFEILWNKVIGSYRDFFPNHDYLLDDFKTLGDSTHDSSTIIQTVIKIVNNL